MSPSSSGPPTTTPGERHGPRPGTIAVLLRLLPFARPAMPSIIAGMVVALVGSLLSLVIPQILRGLVDGPLGDGDSAAVVPAVLLILGLGILEAVMIALRRWFVLKPGTLMEADMRNSFYRKLQRLPVAFHDRWQSGQLLSRMVSDLNLIRRWMAFGLVLFIVNILTILVGIGFLVAIDWRLGIGFLVCSIPLWVYGYLFEQKYSSVARLSQDQSGDLATSVEQSVHGIRVLKAFGRGKHMHDAFAEQAEELRGTEIKKAKAIAGIWLWLLLVPDLTFALALLGGVLLASAGEISVGDLVAFFATAAVLRWPIESVGFLLSMTFDARTAIDRYFEVMDEDDVITDPAAPVRIADPRGHLVFRDVHFRYQDATDGQSDLIDGVDLELLPGETMALVGVTGSGKSTLTALTTRLYDVTGGSIELDGVDIRDLRLDDLRRHMAMAFEDATLFSSSVRENVLLGRPDLAGGGPEADRVLQEALDIAQAGFVHDLPDGVDTTVGEEGLSLSGGQRQRLALARAVAAAPEVLVLDDPLSALDVDTEALVEAALRRVLASTTALIVAHRPSTVMLADRVALMQDGRITAVGRHSDLLASSEHYRFVISSLDVEGNTVREEASA